MPQPKTKNYQFVQNLKCEYFPCHKVSDEALFNCLFCFCPLYMLKEECGGSFSYTKNGVKDCSNCLLPHKKGVGYDHVMDKMKLVINRASK